MKNLNTIITKCNNINCINSEICFRFDEKSKNHFGRDNCKHFWSIKHQPKKQEI